MAKSKIFIASSGRTLTLAESLREQIRTSYCEAELWSDVSAGKPAETIIGMLEDVIKQYDFAAIILAKDDVIITRGDEKLSARDNCIFESGLFMAGIGRKRCFLINSVRQSDLPSDLGGVISLPFEEPADLEDRSACSKAMTAVSSKIKDRVQEKGPIGNRPLSRQALLERERQCGEGGDLYEDQVVVSSVQPLELGYRSALQVRNNIDGGIRYFYFFQGTTDGASKVCQLLQLVLLSRMLSGETEADQFRVRREKIKSSPEAIVDELRQICDHNGMNIFFLPEFPDLQYCIHNAASDYYAKLYLKRNEEYMEWVSGMDAHRFWDMVKIRQGVINAQPPKAVLYGAQGFKVGEGAFFTILKREVERYFPGIDDRVLALCLNGT